MNHDGGEPRFIVHANPHHLIHGDFNSEVRSASLGGHLIGAAAAAGSSDFESNTNFNYSESAYPS